MSPQPPSSPPPATLPPNWNRPKPEAVTEPTWWPSLLALGATFMAWGLITSFIVLLIGLATFAVSLAGWIGEIRYEYRIKQH